MIELKFDKDKVLKVKIGQVQLNSWNPKPTDTVEYKKVLKSISVNGLKGFILVREIAKDKYEVIDGAQRLTAANELGYTEVNVYNEGTVTDRLAKELTIWYQQQVPFDKVEEAKLVSDMLLEYHDEDTLPYTNEEREEMKTLAGFSFDDYKDEENQDTLEGDKPLVLKLSPSEMNEALEVLTAAHVSREEAFMDLVRFGTVREP